MNRFFFVFTLTLTGSVTAFPQRPITFDDLYGYNRIVRFDLSPNGRDIVMEVNEYDLESDSARTNLWTVPSAGGQPVKFTNGDNDAKPSWSPDGQMIAFVGKRHDEQSNRALAQLWQIPAGGGEATLLTAISTEADYPVWSADGKSILFCSSVYPDCYDDDCNREKDELREASKVKARLYDRLLFRHYEYWFDEKRNNIFMMDIETGEYSNLTPFDKDAPPLALAGDEDYSFSPNGSEVCFTMNTDTVVAVSTNNDVFVVSIKGMQLTRISTSAGNDHAPAYSPSGRYLAFLSMATPGYESDQQDLLLYNRIDRTTANLTLDFDRSVSEYIWGPFSTYIYFTAIDQGRLKIYRLNLKDNRIDTLVKDGVCANLQISPDGNYLYYLKSTATMPVEIFEYNDKTRREKRITFFSDTLFTQLKLSPPEDFWFVGAQGDSIHGLLTRPPDMDTAKKYPLVLLIHGGPQWAWLANFNYYGWNTQLMAAQDYVVAQIDPHGSSGYGRDFAASVSGDWGGKPYQDLMLGVDYLIGKYAFIDTTKLAALGRSYGGFMVNWINGQTDRFACLICVDGTFEQISDYYSTDELWFPNWEFGGPPWEVKENYLKYSPAEFVRNFKTPTLVVHGQLDYRVDVSQGLMMFTALQANSVPSQLLYFPDEGHDLRKLHNIRYFYEVQLEWLARYLK